MRCSGNQRHRSGNRFRDQGATNLSPKSSIDGKHVRSFRVPVKSSESQYLRSPTLVYSGNLQNLCSIDIRVNPTTHNRNATDHAFKYLYGRVYGIVYSWRCRCVCLRDGGLLWSLFGHCVCNGMSRVMLKTPTRECVGNHVSLPRACRKICRKTWESVVIHDEALQANTIKCYKGGTRCYRLLQNLQDWKATSRCSLSGQLLNMVSYL